MKTIFTFFITLTFFSMGCSSSENTVSTNNMRVMDATFKAWSESPRGGSEIPERGTDLTVTIRNWPKEYTPQYLVHEGHKSAAANISTQNDSSVVITGRIIHMSSLIVQTEDSVEVSDRLVFTDSNGDTSFVEIEDWKRE